MSRILILSAALFALAGSAAAQGVGVGVPSSSLNTRQPARMSSDSALLNTQSQVERDRAAEQARQRKAAEAKVRSETSPERMARAEKVAALLNDGRCADAAQLALSEGDHELANKVGQVCRKTARR